MPNLRFSSVAFLGILLIVPTNLLMLPLRLYADTAIATEDISTDTVWTKAASPYLIEGQVTFDSSTTLSIEPGAEIDFGPTGYLEVYGDISVGSTSADGVWDNGNTVTFSGSHPDQGDGKGCDLYNVIDIYGQASSTAVLSHFEMGSGLELYLHKGIADISYGKFDCGMVGVRVENAQADIADSAFTDFDDTALQVVSSGVSIARTTFDGGAGIGLSSLASNLVVDQSTAENFSIGMNIVATDATVTSSLFKQNGTGAQVSDRVFLSSLVSLPPLRKNFSNIYMNGNIFDDNYRAATTSQSVGKFTEEDDWAGDAPASSTVRRPVIVIPGILGSALDGYDWVIDPIFHIYDNLLDTLRANGFVDGVSLFPFGYDWHQSNEETANQLADFIGKVRGVCSCDTVDIVAHSMGGLIARQYIQSAEYKGDVGRVIFLGTPHLGSPSAYLTYMYDSFGDTVDDKVLAFMFGREAKANGYDSISHYIQGLPIRSVRELLPITPFLYDVSGLLPYSDGHYVLNDFLTDLRSGVKELLERVDVFNIFGESEDVTPAGFAVDGFAPDQNAQGWIMVVGKSATSDLGDGSVVWSDARSQLGTKSMVIDSGHGDLPTNAEGLVVRALTGVAPTVTVDKPFGPSYDLMIIQTLFPMHIFVIDPDGQYVGYDDAEASSSDDDDDDLTPAPTIPIDRAFYQEEASSTYVSIPHPKKGKYTIVVSSKEKDPKKAKTVKKVTVDTAVSSGKTFTTKRTTIPEIKPLKKKKIKIIVRYIKDPPTVDASSTAATSTATTTEDDDGQTDSSDDDSDDEEIDGGQTDLPPLDDTMAPEPEDFSDDTDVASDTSQTSSSTQDTSEDAAATSTATTTIATTTVESADSDSENNLGSVSGGSSGGGGGVNSPPHGQSIPLSFTLARTSFRSLSYSGGYHPTSTSSTTATTTILLLKIRLLTLEIEWYNRLMEILEKLFGGAAKVRIIKLFLFNPEALYTRADVISRVKSPIKDVKSSIALLEKVKFIKSKMVTTEKKKRAEAWYLDQTFPYIGALQSLLINIMPLSSTDISRRLQKAGKMKLVVISGVFIQNTDSRVDLLVVGDGIKRGSLENAVKGLEADIGKELTYAYFDTDDYLYRLGMYDKLVRDILDFPHTVVVDKISA